MLSESVRIKFAKVGKLKYISHLDLSRTMKTAFKRGRIPLKYTEGFNPHPKLVFALTVSVGSESVCEYLDVTLSEPVSKEKFCESWANAMTKDLELLDVYKPETKFSEIAFSEYEIVFDRELDEELIKNITEKPMIVKKHGKKGDKEVDIIGSVKSLAVSGNKLTAVLCASQSDYLNPEYLVKGLAAAGFEFEDYSVKRVNVLKSDMSEFA